MATAPCYPSAVTRDMPHLGDDADRARLAAWAACELLITPPAGRMAAYRGDLGSSVVITRQTVRDADER